MLYMALRKGALMKNRMSRIPPWAMLAVSTVAVAAKPGAETFHYGPDRANILDVYRPENVKHAPILLFIHGGGWSAGSRSMGEGGQPAYFKGEGYAWVSMGYRMVPKARVEDQAEDVAAAIAWLRNRAEKLHLDPESITLIGHSSGAHLAALVATDPRWLEKEHLPISAIKGVISIDGAALDVPGMMSAGAKSSPYYSGAFGVDEARQTSLSPQAHAAAPNAGKWLFLFDGDHNSTSGYFAGSLAAALSNAGAEASVTPIMGTTHMRMINELGKPGDEVTEAIDLFLGAKLAPVP